MQMSIVRSSCSELPRRPPQHLQRQPEATGTKPSEQMGKGGQPASPPHATLPKSTHNPLQRGLQIPGVRAADCNHVNRLPITQSHFLPEPPFRSEGQLGSPQRTSGLPYSRIYCLPVGLRPRDQDSARRCGIACSVERQRLPPLQRHDADKDVVLQDDNNTGTRHTYKSHITHTVHVVTRRQPKARFTRCD